MIAVYSIKNRIIAIYTRIGTLLFYTTEPIEVVKQKYGIDDRDVHITF